MKCTKIMELPHLHIRRFLNMLNSKLLIVSLVIGIIGLYISSFAKPILRIIGLIIVIIAGVMALKAHGKL